MPKSRRSSIDKLVKSTSIDTENERALAELHESIGTRIRPLLARLPETELEALIDRMARIQLAYRGGRRTISRLAGDREL